MSSPTPTDDDQAGTDLAHRACTDQALMDELIGLYHRRLIGRVRAFGVPNDAIDDIAQTVWLKACRHLQNARTFEGNFRAWLFRLAFNEVMDYRRRNATAAGRTGTLTDGDLPPDPKAADPSALAEAGEDILRLRRCVEHLPPNQRDVVRKRLEGLDPTEIAEAIQARDRSQVDALFFKAKKNLENCLSGPPMPPPKVTPPEH